MADSILDPVIDPELRSIPLDLSRPELSPLLLRYRTKPVQEPAKLMPPKTALIVDSATADAGPWMAALEKNGWSLSSCHGPGTGSCPLMRGAKCVLRETADVAVVYLDPDRMWPAAGTLPRIRCAADSASPAVVALEGRRSEPSFSGRHATIGADREAQVLLDVIDVLCDEKAW